jgi:hypothetical protein
MDGDSYYQSGEMGAGRIVADTALMCALQKPCPLPIDTESRFYPYEQGFESSTFPPVEWRTYNKEEDAPNWHRTTEVGGYQHSNSAAKVDLYNIDRTTSFYRTDKLSTIPFHFKFYSNPIVFSFNIAHAQYSNQVDSLILYEAHNKCNLNKKRIWAKGGEALATTSSTTDDFVPQHDEWRTEAVRLNQFTDAEQLVLTFVAKSKGGNNIYLDDINIDHDTLATIPQKPSKTSSSFKVYPNPTSLNSITLEVPFQTSYSLQILDRTGALQHAARYQQPTQTVNLSTLSSGLYFVRVISEQGQSYTRKVMVR